MIFWLTSVLVALYVLSSLITVWMIGKPRETTTPGSAIATLFINAGFIAATIYLASH